jgi:hypothetical protein
LAATHIISPELLHNFSISQLYYEDNGLRKGSIIKKTGEIKMNKKIKWLIGGAVAGLLLIAIAIPALAAGPNGVNGNAAANTVQTGCGSCQGLGFGPDQEVADFLGLTTEQVRDQRLSGKSLIQIAAEQGVSEEDLINAIMAEKQEAVRNMVEAGTLTQEQADLRLAQMRERVQLAVNRTAVGPPEWAGANGNGQKGQGMRGQSEQRGNQNCTGSAGTCTGTGKMMRSGRTAK